MSFTRQRTSLANARNKRMWIPILIPLSVALFGFTLKSDNPWGGVKLPSRGSMGPIGGYSAGCVDGALTLEKEGTGFQVMRLSRNRYYGHTSLMSFIKEYTGTVYARKIGTLLLGDISQPRGGPMTSGHASHQVGLDMDVWFWLNPEANHRSLTAKERETLSAPSMVDLAKFVIDRDQWRPEHVDLLKIAAQNPVVERIFVNPVIKKELCEITGTDRAWLKKIRPWWGHNAHFHVRIKCPDGAKFCRPQEAVPEGDGCGSELDWWFEPGNREAPASSGEKKLPELPGECETVLHS